MSEQLTKSQIKKQIIEAAIKEYVGMSKFERSIAKTALKYGINKKTLTKYLKEKGIEIVANKGAYSIDESVFEIIDSEEKAYWLGFLYADGYVATNSNQIGLGLMISDIKHLEKYKNFMKWHGEIRVYKEHQFGNKDNHNKKGEEMYNCKVIITNEKIHRDLVNLGCVPNKSLILQFPSEDQVPKEFQTSFVRGYFDGDGTLGLYQHSKKNPRLEESLMIVGTKPFLEKVQEILGPGYLMQKRNCNENTYRLGYSTIKAFKAAEIMYKDASIYLDRKYNIYINEYCPYRAKSVKTEMSTPR